MSNLFIEYIKREDIKEKITDRRIPVTQLKQATRDVNSLIAKENLTSMDRRFASLEVKGDSLVATIDTANQAVVGALVHLSNDIELDPKFMADQNNI